MGVTLSKRRVIHGCLDIQHVLVPGEPANSSSNSKKHVSPDGKLPGWSSPLKWGPTTVDWSPPLGRMDRPVPPIKAGDGNGTIANVVQSAETCELCLRTRGSLASVMSSDSFNVDDASSDSPEHTRTADCWTEPADRQLLEQNPNCFACTRPRRNTVFIDYNDDDEIDESTVVQIHASVHDRDAARDNGASNDGVIETRATTPADEIEPTTTAER